MSVKQSPHEEYDRGFSNGWDACAARAQPAQAVPASCGECGKKTSEGWALYCVACMEEAGLPAQAVPLLSDDELRELEKKFNAERVRTSDEEYLVIYPSDYYEWQRAVEQAVRAKLGVSVPMTEQDHALVLEAAIDDITGDEMYTWAFIDGIRAAEKFHGIVGKEGA